MFYLDAVLTQPLIAALGAHAGTISTHWAPTRPPVLWAFPGHLFSAWGGQLGPGFQRASRMEMA
eukprot:6709976-Pyramimonas_sp.AAC.1